MDIKIETYTTGSGTTVTDNHDNVAIIKTTNTMPAPTVFLVKADANITGMKLSKSNP